MIRLKLTDGIGNRVGERIVYMVSALPPKNTIVQVFSKDGQDKLAHNVDWVVYDLEDDCAIAKVSPNSVFDNFGVKKP